MTQMTHMEAQQILLNQAVEGNFGKVAVVLEGRDTAGKTGTIRELTPANKPKSKIAEQEKPHAKRT